MGFRNQSKAILAAAFPDLENDTFEMGMLRLVATGLMIREKGPGCLFDFSEHFSGKGIVTASMKRAGQKGVELDMAHGVDEDILLPWGFTWFMMSVHWGNYPPLSFFLPSLPVCLPSPCRASSEPPGPGPRPQAWAPRNGGVINGGWRARSENLPKRYLNEPPGAL
eukprot:3458074-Pyramimonas_sp.AAC.1